MSREVTSVVSFNIHSELIYLTSARFTLTIEIRTSNLVFKNPTVSEAFMKLNNYIAD